MRDDEAEKLHKIEQRWCAEGPRDPGTKAKSRDPWIQ